MVLGDEVFAEGMLKLAGRGVISRKNRTYRSGAVSRAHDEREAERLSREGLAVAGLDGDALGRLPGSDARKAALANLLLERTVARQSWIAAAVGHAECGQRQPAGAPLPEKKPEIALELKAYLKAVEIC